LKFEMLSLYNKKMQSINQNNKVIPTGKEVPSVQTCPQCESFFIDDKECESCGFQFDTIKVGAPFSEKSFYYYFEEYWDGVPIRCKLWPLVFKTSKRADYSRYQQKNLRRFHLICQYLSLPSKNYEDRNLYFIELKLIMEKLVDGFFDEHVLEGIAKLKGAVLNHLSLEYSILINERKKSASSLNFSSILNYRPFVAFNIKYYLLLVGTLAIMIFMALSFSFY
jgi:hypothetical protein